MFRKLLVLSLFLSFGFSTFESFFTIYEEESITMSDDFCDDTESEDDKKIDKILPQKVLLNIPFFCLLPQNRASIDFVPAMLMAQYAIDTPPPEGC
jgi:hypothetical protein